MFAFVADCSGLADRFVTVAFLLVSEHFAMRVSDNFVLTPCSRVCQLSTNPSLRSWRVGRDDDANLMVLESQHQTWV
jgi:hypothetical protein